MLLVYAFNPGLVFGHTIMLRVVEISKLGPTCSDLFALVDL